MASFRGLPMSMLLGLLVVTIYNDLQHHVPSQAEANKLQTSAILDASTFALKEASGYFEKQIAALDKPGSR